MTGHPLENTWGGIYGSDEPWLSPDIDGPPPLMTASPVAITPVHDGFLVVPERGSDRYTVMYMQSLLPPSPHGILTYTGGVSDPDAGGVIIDSVQFDGALTPVPEPGTIVLFGLGLATLAAKRRAISRRPGGRSR